VAAHCGALNSHDGAAGIAGFLMGRYKPANGMKSSEYANNNFNKASDFNKRLECPLNFLILLFEEKDLKIRFGR